MVKNGQLLTFKLLTLTNTDIKTENKWMHFFAIFYSVDVNETVPTFKRLKYILIFMQYALPRKPVEKFNVEELRHKHIREDHFRSDWNSCHSVADILLKSQLTSQPCFVNKREQSQLSEYLLYC